MAVILDFPAERRPAAYDPRPIDRAELRAVLTDALDHCFNAVDALLARLDALDGDTDLEDGPDDEPSLAAPCGGSSQVPWSAGGDRDLELAR